MPTLADNVFNFIFEDKEAHQKAIQTLPPEKRGAMMGRKAKIIVAGPEGGTFITRFTPMGLIEDTDDRELRNSIWMTDGTLFEILVWLSEDPRDPGISPREAAANHLLRFQGERSLYDSEEVYDALEIYAFERMRPIAKKAVAEMRSWE